MNYHYGWFFLRVYYVVLSYALFVFSSKRCGRILRIRQNVRARERENILGAHTEHKTENTRTHTHTACRLYCSPSLCAFYVHPVYVQYVLCTYPAAPKLVCTYMVHAVGLCWFIAYTMYTMYMLMMCGWWSAM